MSVVTEAPTPRWSRYVAIGDSFTEGLWDDPDGREAPQRGWADLLASHLSARRSAAGEAPLEYANLAIRGRLLRPIVTEQLDAISALGADPVKKLVLPRLIASILVLPIVGTFALILGFTGAMVITDTQFGIPAAFFFRSALDQLVLMDYLMGLVKTPVFGAIIALLGCYFGMCTRGGTAGVGSSTTKTVVAISITILIADFFLTKLVFLAWNIF